MKKSGYDESRSLFVYKGKYTVEEWDEGLRFMRSNIKEYDFSDRDCLIILNNHDNEYNKCVLNYLCILKLQKSIRYFLVVSDRDMINLIYKESTVPFRFVKCKEDELNFLLRISAIYSWKNIYRTGFEGCLDVDVSILEKEGDVSLKTVVAIGILGLDAIPSDEEVKLCRLKPSEEMPVRNEYLNQINKTVSRRQIPFSDEDEYYRACADLVIKNQNVNKKDRIVMFGVMKTSLQLMNFLTGYSFVGFADNDVSKVGTFVQGLPVIAPEDIIDVFGNEIKIIVTSKYTYEIAEQLIGLGFSLNKEIIIAYEKYDLYHEMLINPGRVLYDITKVGKRIYEDIREQYPDETMLHIPYAGTGDAFLAGMYAKRICLEHGIESHIFVVASAVCGKVLELFEERYTIIEQSKALELLRYTRLIGFDTANYVVLNDSFGQNIAIRLRARENVDFHTMFAKCVFRVDKRLRFPENMIQENADCIFVDNKLRKGKTVFLSPYAKTVFLFPQGKAIKRIDDEIWGIIAAYFKSVGLDVCTNVASKNEKAIKGTIGVFVPYNKVVDFVNKAGFFVGVRSGLCDIIASSTAVKCIIYTINNGAIGDVRRYNYRYFSLERMRISDGNLFEIEVDPDSVDNLPHIIKKYISDKLYMKEMAEDYV